MRTYVCKTIGCGALFEAAVASDFCTQCMSAREGLITTLMTALPQIEVNELMATSGGFHDRLQEDRKHAHYYRSVEGLTEVDVYRILEIFNVTDHPLAHIAKKALCAGLRGHKDLERDLNDIIDTAERKLEMLEEDRKRGISRAA